MENRKLKNVNEDEIIDLHTKIAKEVLERRKPFVPKD